MPLVNVSGQAFPPPYGGLNEAWDERWRLPHVVLAAFLAGRRRGKRFAAGTFSVAEMIASVSLIRANLRVAQNRFAQSPAYATATRSQKSFISYTIGQTFAHLFMTRHLDVRYTMDVDRYAAELGIVGLPGSQSIPDLIGFGQGWVVAEAKGRTWWLDTRTMQHAIQQKRAISTVGGIAPSLCLAAVTHFRAGFLAITASDPDPLEGLRLPEDPLEFIRIFYSPIMTWLAQEGVQREVLGRSVLVRDVPELDLAIGLDSQVAEAVGSDSGLRSISESAAAELSPGEADGNSAFEPSGVVVRLGSSWPS